jgi:hypothetical protein
MRKPKKSCEWEDFVLPVMTKRITKPLAKCVRTIWKKIWLLVGVGLTQNPYWLLGAGISALNFTEDDG